jgi:hypothetical protein
MWSGEILEPLHACGHHQSVFGLADQVEVLPLDAEVNDSKAARTIAPVHERPAHRRPELAAPQTRKARQDTHGHMERRAPVEIRPAPVRDLPTLAFLSTLAATRSPAPSDQPKLELWF